MDTFLYYRSYPGFSANSIFARDKKALVDVCQRSMDDSQPQYVFQLTLVS